MVFGLPRPASGYIRYLQTSAVQTVTHRAQDLLVQRVALVLGVLGIAMSGYSSRQLSFHHRPTTRILAWMSKPAINVESPGSPSLRVRMAPANAGTKKDEHDQPIKVSGNTEQHGNASSGM